MSNINGLTNKTLYFTGFICSACLKHFEIEKRIVIIEGLNTVRIHCNNCAIKYYTKQLIKHYEKQN